MGGTHATLRLRHSEWSGRREAELAAARVLLRDRSGGIGNDVLDAVAARLMSRVAPAHAPAGHAVEVKSLGAGASAAAAVPA